MLCRVPSYRRPGLPSPTTSFIGAALRQVRLNPRPGIGGSTLLRLLFLLLLRADDLRLARRRLARALFRHLDRHDALDDHGFQVGGQNLGPFRQLQAAQHDRLVRASGD